MSTSCGAPLNKTRENACVESVVEEALTGSLERALFYQRHLDRVSRSFAFCIARLEPELRERVGLSYLLCRILDTVEDAEWPSFHDQERAFGEFNRFLQAAVQENVTSLKTDIAFWVKSFPPTLSIGEKELLRDAAVILCDFQRWPERFRNGLGRLVLSMSAGMQHFMTKKQGNGRLVLADLAAVNRYCFFVAGLVGEMLTGFLPSEPLIAPPTAPNSAVRTERLCDAYRFGMFLQKVNLLKDQSSDQKQGRFLVPSRPKVFSSLLADADGAFRFFNLIPKREVGFRLFCAWSLYLGLASLPWIEKAEAGGIPLKIPREEAAMLFQMVENLIDDREALARLYHDLRLELEANANSQESEASSEKGAEHFPPRGNLEETELVKFYLGELPEDAVRKLFDPSPDVCMKV